MFITGRFNGSVKFNPLLSFNWSLWILRLDLVITLLFINFILKEVRQVALNGPKVTSHSPYEVVTPVIELPTLDPITHMIETGQPHCTIEDVFIQNGVTTNQVFHLQTIYIIKRDSTTAEGRVFQIPASLS